MGNLSIKQEPIEREPSLGDITPDERGRLLTYCMRVTGDRNVAEDLVQQTLLEAWLHASRLYSADVRMPWLFGIARNICLQWLRSRRREVSRQVRLGIIGDESEET